MLKIKDNVDLKELEKYGFVEMDNIKFYTKKVIRNAYDGIDYYINIDTRIIEINSNEKDEQLDDTLYDLIKDGLVIKAEER